MSDDDTGVPTNEETAVEDPALPGGEALDEFDQRLADLGAPPGYASSAAESDRYNFAVAEIEADRANAIAEGLGDEEIVPTEDTSGKREDVILLDPPDYAAVAAGNKGEAETTPATHDDGAMGAATP